MTSRAQPLVVLAALEVEAIALARRLRPSRRRSPGLATWVGDGVALIVCGVGKVAAARATQYACDVMRPVALISIGLAGGVETGARAGRLIVATGAVQHDYDARPIAPARGVMPDLGVSTFQADEEIVERLVRSARLVTEDQTLVRTGLVLTGDQIITSRAVRDGILREFPDGACFDMETAAVAQVALANGVRWGGLRITSDAADESFNVAAVLGFGGSTASELLARIVHGLTEPP
ncbi:MAG: hypothetical protein ACHQ0J_08050 [Candidatus Dormibacterales bacterium]